MSLTSELNELSASVAVSDMEGASEFYEERGGGGGGSRGGLWRRGKATGGGWPISKVVELGRGEFG